MDKGCRNQNPGPEMAREEEKTVWNRYRQVRESPNHYGK